jgi:hypothetical protein
VNYEERRVTTYTFAEGGKPLLGEWAVEFFFGTEKIGAQHLSVVEQERYEATMRLEKKAVL